MGKGVRYTEINTTPEQDLMFVMNWLDRQFMEDKISHKKWYKGQMKAIKRYRKLCQKV